MVDQNILAGLKNAVSRGQTLEKASMSFVNAGYSREDVEDAVDEIKSFGVLNEVKVPAKSSATEKDKDKDKEKITLKPVVISDNLSPAKYGQEFKKEIKEIPVSDKKEIKEIKKLQNFSLIPSPPRPSEIGLPEPPKMIINEKKENKLLEENKSEKKEERAVKNEQKVSEYGMSEEKKRKGIIIILILAMILILLLGVLGIVLFKKDWILKIFNGLFFGLV